MTGVLTRVAIEQCGVERVDVQIDPGNEPSAGVPRKLGFTLEGMLRRRLEPRDGRGPRRDSMLFTLVREELPGSGCLAYDYAAYDARGERLP